MRPRMVSSQRRSAMLVSQTEIRATLSDGYLLPSISRKGGNKFSEVTNINASDGSGFPAIHDAMPPWGPRALRAAPGCTTLRAPPVLTRSQPPGMSTDRLRLRQRANSPSPASEPVPPPSQLRFPAAPRALLDRGLAAISLPAPRRLLFECPSLASVDSRSRTSRHKF